MRHTLKTTPTTPSEKRRAENAFDDGRIMEKFFMFSCRLAAEEGRKSPLQFSGELHSKCVSNDVNVCMLKFISSVILCCVIFPLSRFKYGFSLKVDSEIMFADAQRADKIGNQEGKLWKFLCGCGCCLSCGYNMISVENS